MPPLSHRSVLPVVVVLLMIVEVVVVGVVLWPRGDDDLEYGPGPIALQSMPSAPGERWKLTAEDVLGADEPADERASISIKAQSDDVVVVVGAAEPHARTTTLAAVDVQSGKVLWSRREAGHWADCAVGDGPTLACTKNVRVSGDVVARVSFFDLASGAERVVQTVRVHGTPSIVSVDDGFVVAVPRDSGVGLREEGPVPDRGAATVDRRPLITRFEPTGQRSWSVNGSTGERTVRSVIGSRVIVMESDDGAVSFYRADTGTLVHREPTSMAPSCGAPDEVTGMMVCTSIVGQPSRPNYLLYEGGFAVNPAGGSPVTVTYDETGRRTGRLVGWWLADDDDVVRDGQLVEPESIPVVSGRKVGVVTADTGALRWTRAVTGDGIAKVRALDERHVAVGTSEFGPGDAYSETWRLIDAATGESGGTVTSNFGAWLFGFDGRRLLFAGDPAEHQRPNAPRLTAFDGENGSRRWTIDPADRDAGWQQVGRVLYSVGSTGYGPGWIARYAS